MFDCCCDVYASQLVEFYRIFTDEIAILRITVLRLRHMQMR